MTQSVDLLVFAAHPDDAEIGIGGILAKHHAAGLRTVLCHLTEAELSSNGTVERRREEAKAAAKILGISELINLGFPDRGLNRSPEQILKMTQVIRQYRPQVVLAPYFDDRHPDHVACSHMAKEAVFDAAIRKKQTPGNEPAHRVPYFYYYFINNIAKADIIVDVSDVYHRKQAALAAYASQFSRSEGEVETPLNQPAYQAMIEGRDSIWGYQIGTRYGEGLVSPHPVKKNLLIP
jgi:bacillithiol biosynthesis deacetylase BshB1